MKKRHNKKRNIAFVYEALVREATVAVMRKDGGRRDKVVNILKNHFGQNSLLKRELDCYRSLYENQSLDETTSQKILVEARMHRRAIDPNGLFKQKTELIKDINQDLSPSVFNNFVPNYKSHATISQIFSTKTSPKTRVMMEQQVIAAMSRKPNTEDTPEIDNVVYQSFVKKFNDKYGGELLDEQKHFSPTTSPLSLTTPFNLRCFSMKRLHVSRVICRKRKAPPRLKPIQKCWKRLAE